MYQPWWPDHHQIAWNWFNSTSPISPDFYTSDQIITFLGIGSHAPKFWGKYTSRLFIWWMKRRVQNQETYPFSSRFFETICRKQRQQQSMANYHSFQHRHRRMSLLSCCRCLSPRILAGPSIDYCIGKNYEYVTANWFWQLWFHLGWRGLFFSFFLVVLGALGGEAEGALEQIFWRQQPQQQQTPTGKEVLNGDCQQSAHFCSM